MRLVPDERPSTIPRSASLLVRTNLLLAASAIAIVVVAMLALNRFVIDPIAERSADDEAALLVLTAQTWVELPPEARPYFELELAENHDLFISAEPRDLPPAEQGLPYLDLVAEKLSERLNTTVQLKSDAELVWADVPMGGYVIQIGFSPSRRDVQPLSVALIIVVLGAGIVFGTSLLIVQRIARPLVKAAELVGTFRGGEGFTPLPEEGPRELVTLARSFNTMAREISTLLANRTTLLAGISHDLRTPLARMRLALELLPENVDRKLVARFERNLEAMDELIGDALTFARGAGEPKRMVELRGFLRETVAAIDEQARFVWHGPEEQTIGVAVGALRRVLQNLIANAHQHGGGTPAVEVHATRERTEIHVVDRGPGIPVDFRDKVFQPFFRLDGSRSLTTGGSGLGLAIVQQLCQAHGWRVAIRDLSGGGTDIVVEIPIVGT
jgi:two-component system osmolarity sensor histidine kinase EnvZ